MTKKKSKKKLFIILGIVLVVAIAAVVIMSGMNSRVAAMAEDDGYEVMGVQIQDMQVEVRGSGSVQAADSTKFYSTAEIKVDEVLVEEGSEVAQGDAIAKLDADSIELQVDAIEAEIEVIDDEISSMKSTEGDDSIGSPAEGTVKAINVIEGDLISVAMDTYGSLMTISVDDRMKVVTATETIDAVTEGDIVSITFPADEEGEESEVVTSIVSYVDRLTGTFEFVIEDEDYEIGQSVEVADESGAVIGIGIMQINTPVYLKATTGTVEDVEVEVGEYVDRNETLITLDDDGLLSETVVELTQDRESLEKELADITESLAALGLDSNYIIYAPQGGVITNLNLQDKGIVQEDALMFDLETTDMLEMVVAIDELDILEIELGQVANVSFEAIPGEIISAEVTNINTVGVSNNNVTNYDVTVTFPKTDGVLIGMSGTADILSESRENAVTIPLEAIQIINNEYYVILGEDAESKTVADHKISVGINNGTYIEVTEGLSEGDSVVVQSVNPDTASAMMSGMMGGMTGGVTGDRPSGMSGANAPSGAGMR